MGIRRTGLAWLVLVAGITGGVVALLMQWWTNAVDYPLNISGKPLFSLPANIPVTFELIVLFSCLYGLPRRAGVERTCRDSTTPCSVSSDLHGRRRIASSLASTPTTRLLMRPATRVVRSGRRDVGRSGGRCPDARPHTVSHPPGRHCRPSRSRLVPTSVDCHGSADKIRHPAGPPGAGHGLPTSFRAAGGDASVCRRAHHASAGGGHRRSTANWRDDDHFYRGLDGEEFAADFPRPSEARHDGLDATGS